MSLHYEIVGRESSAKVIKNFKNRKSFERKEIKGKKVLTMGPEEEPEEQVCTCEECPKEEEKNVIKCPRCGYVISKEEEEEEQEEEQEEPQEEEEVKCTCHKCEKPKPEVKTYKPLKRAPLRTFNPKPTHKRETLTIRTQNAVRREYKYAPQTPFK